MPYRHNIWNSFKYYRNQSTPTITNLYVHEYRSFSSKLTKGVNWSKRRKIIRITNYKRNQSLLHHTQKRSQKGNDQTDNDDGDIFLESMMNTKSSSPSVNKKLKDLSREDNRLDEEAMNKEYKLRPALLTQMIKGTRDPKTLMVLWLRDRSECRIDHINCSAALVHLAQLCLQKVPSERIYNKIMSWSVIRLIRDLMSFVEHYDLRQIANIMWALGVLTQSNNNDKKLHRDFRRLAAKLINRIETTLEIRRKCNVQNMVDILWAMNCLGLEQHPFFYQFCVEIFGKLDIDVGVTPDALAYLSVLYANRTKQREKLKNKSTEIFNEKIGKEFWLKLLGEFSDDFVLIEASPHQIANILWSISRIGNITLNNLNAIEQQTVTDNINKLLKFVQDRLDECDGQTMGLLVWAVTYSNYKPLMICKKHAIFDYDNKHCIGSRISQLIESTDCVIIPNLQTPHESSIEKYSNIKAFNITLVDSIVILQCVSNELTHCIPPYVLTLLLNRIREQLKYSNLNTRDLISLIESVDLMGSNDDLFHQIIAKKLIQSFQQRDSKAKWNYSEFISLIKVINKSEVLYKNLDLIHGMLRCLQFNKQGWGQMKHEPLEIFHKHFIDLHISLRENNLLQESTESDEIFSFEMEQSSSNLTHLIKSIDANIKHKLKCDI